MDNLQQHNEQYAKIDKGTYVECGVVVQKTMKNDEDGLGQMFMRRKKLLLCLVVLVLIDFYHLLEGKLEKVVIWVLEVMIFSARFLVCEMYKSWRLGRGA